MKKNARVEVRMTQLLRNRLLHESKACEESLNTYLLMIIGHRKRVKLPIPTEEGYYRGF